MKNTLSTLCILAVLSQASAATFVTSAPATGTATGNFTTVFLAPVGGVTINSLGAYDSGGNGLIDTLTVRVWPFGGPAALASATISGLGDGAVDGFVYKDLASSISLTGGAYYTVSVSGFTSDTPYNNATLATFDAALGVLAGGNGGGAVFTTFGNGNDGSSFSGTSFAAGSFSTVKISAVPEPETYAMLAGLGLVGFGLYRRCRK